MIQNLNKMSLSNIVYSNKIPTNDLLKVVEVSHKLGVHPNWLMAVMNFETGGTLSPSTKNNIGSVGLIQFTRDRAGVEYKTINGVRYQLSELAKMSFTRQMDVVYEYFKPFKGKIKSFLDLYLVTFFPVALGKSNDFVFQTSGLSASLIAKQNPIFDTNKDSKITKGEVLEFWKKKLGILAPQVINSQPKEMPTDIKESLTKVLQWLGIAVVVFFYTGFTVQTILN